MIDFEQVTKYYNESDGAAVENISLHIDRGEFISIVGHSGAGKTTLLKLILGEHPPTEGSLYFEDTDIATLSRRALTDLRRRIGTIFQNFRLLPNKTAYENIAFAMEVAGRSDDDIASDVPYALELVDLQDKMWSFPGELSGGQKQRLAIARALVNQPDVIIADEPTGNLDPINTYEVVQILKKVNDLGTTVLLTTHNKGVIDSLGRRVVTMDKGKIIRDDTDGRYVL